MRKLMYLFALVTLSAQAFAKPLYQIDESVSTVNFATIKKQYIIEPAVINGVSGSIDESGMLKAMIPLNQIKTGIPIRNDRLNELFFNSNLFPNIKVEAKVPADLLKDGMVVSQVSLPASVTLFGNTQSVQLTVNVVKHNDIIAVSTVKPVVISAAAYGIPSDNLTKLAATVGNIVISDTVPVNISLVLKK